jgi:predicted TIM-barrel fold metal-dependent hydrolase
MPENIGIIDCMMGFPAADMHEQYAFITKQTKDRQSKEDFEFPVEYMFKDSPDKKLKGVEPITTVLEEMDRWGIERALIGTEGEVNQKALKVHADRFIPQVGVDANEGMEAVRKIVKAYELYGAKAIGMFPAGMFPQVPINDKKMYPIYAKACELDIPVFVCTGIPGPRIKFACQHVELVDEVMYDFPELVYVFRHGCEPWTELAVKLMLKWPGLYYSTSAFAPKHYNQHIINYANTRGADKVIYAGYYPMGLSLERIMTEMPGVKFKDEVWPKFLRGNAERVLKL